MIPLFFRPAYIVLICACLLFFELVLKGKLLRLVQLYRQREQIQQSISQYDNKLLEVQRAIRFSEDPKFIEKLARERFYLVGKNDLIFIFNE